MRKRPASAVSRMGHSCEATFGRAVRATRDEFGICILTRGTPKSVTRGLGARQASRPCVATVFAVGPSVPRRAGVVVRCAFLAQAGGNCEGPRITPRSPVAPFTAGSVALRGCSNRTPVHIELRANMAHRAADFQRSFWPLFWGGADGLILDRAAAMMMSGKQLN